MSTIDPDAKARAEAARTPTARDLFWPVVVAFALPLLAGFFLTRMLANAIENDAFDVFSVIALVLTFPGFGALVFTMIRWFQIVSRNTRLPDISLGIGLAFIGGTLGHAMSAPVPEWVQAPALEWTTIVGFVFGVGIIVLGAWLQRRSRAQDAFEDEVMRTTPPVVGVVTNQGYDRLTPDGETRALLTHVTYAFEDASGTRRFVKRMTRIPYDDPLANGDRVNVWFDRTDPSNQKRIIIRRR